MCYLSMLTAATMQQTHSSCNSHNFMTRMTLTRRGYSLSRSLSLGCYDFGKGLSVNWIVCRSARVLSSAVAQAFGGRPANATRTVRGTASCMHSDRARIMVAIIVIVAVLSYILVLAAPGGRSEFELQSILGLVPSGECRHWVAR